MRCNIRRKLTTNLLTVLEEATTKADTYHSSIGNVGNGCHGKSRHFQPQYLITLRLKVLDYTEVERVVTMTHNVRNMTVLFIRNSIIGIFIAFISCIGLNIISSSGVPYNIFSWQNAHWIPGSGGLQALAFGGIIISLLLMQDRTNKNIKNLYVSSVLGRDHY